MDERCTEGADDLRDREEDAALERVLQKQRREKDKCEGCPMVHTYRGCDFSEQCHLTPTDIDNLLKAIAGEGRLYLYQLPTCGICGKEIRPQYPQVIDEVGVGEYQEYHTSCFGWQDQGGE